MRFHDHYDHCISLALLRTFPNSYCLSLFRFTAKHTARTTAIREAAPHTSLISSFNNINSICFGICVKYKRDSYPKTAYA